MADKAAPRGRWADLPIELWGKILVLAYQQQCGGAGDNYASLESLQAVLPFPTLYQQLLVCKTINAAFVKQSWLYRDLLVSAQATQVEALQEWTQHHHAAIQNIVAGLDLTGPECQSPFKDVALVALYDQGACLRSAHIAGATCMTVSLLSTFHTITQCTFHNPFGVLSLLALKDLPNLVKLDVQSGSFTHIDAAKHLTQLILTDAAGYCAHGCAFVTSLMGLDMYLASLTSFHVDGLAACSRLQKLRCSRAGIIVNEFLDDDGDEHHILSALSSLSRLTYLCLSFRSNKLVLRCDWLAALPGLQHLAFYGNVKLIEFPECVSTLTNLRTFHVSVSYGRFAYESHAVCKFDWMKLRSLQEVSVQTHISFERGLSDLAAVETLRQVTFGRMQRAGSVLQHQVAELKEQLRRNRPNVLFVYKLGVYE